jgi:hypothetical protein
LTRRVVLYLGGRARVRRRFADRDEIADIAPGDVSVQDGGSDCK